MAAKRVIVIGGGVGGLSAAHELVERGFDVEVYERGPVPGGKARSVDVPAPGGRPLPGEHGFRFFPGFYRHLPDTMKRIPFGSHPHGVFDNLVTVDTALLGERGRVPRPVLTHVPRSWPEFKLAMHELSYPAQLGLTLDDFDFFLHHMWRLMTSCRERRLVEYEAIPWWTFIDADARSIEYQDFLAAGLTRSLVAAQPRTASTRTIGDILLQLNLDMSIPGKVADRVLNGPTNQVWIGPWLEHLRQRGVRYTLDARIERIEVADGAIGGVVIRQGDVSRSVQGDYYVFAVPVEVMAQDQLLGPHVLALDPALESLKRLRNHVAWMNGIQFYLRRDVLRGGGHALLINTPWALTSISQLQFWPDYPIGESAGGQVRGILSVDISDWTTPGTLFGKPAQESTRDEIRLEVLAQLEACLDVGGADVLRNEDVVAWHLDDDIERAPGHPPTEVNLEPLLVNEVGTWALRPEAHTGVRNMFLASDYVRTFTDLATMEAANEAARRAVNAILAVSGSTAKPCELWDLHEPAVLAPLRALDYLRFTHGRPWEHHDDPASEAL